MYPQNRSNREYELFLFPGAENVSPPKILEPRWEQAFEAALGGYDIFGGLSLSDNIEAQQQQKARRVNSLMQMLASQVSDRLALILLISYRDSITVCSFFLP